MSDDLKLFSSPNQLALTRALRSELKNVTWSSAPGGVIETRRPSLMPFASSRWILLAYSADTRGSRLQVQLTKHNVRSLV